MDWTTLGSPLDYERALYATALWAMYGFALLTFVLLFFVSAPFGRHARAGWGPTMPARLGWVVMEAPAVVLYLAIYLQGDHRTEFVPLVLLGLWQLHYVQRTLIFPFKMRADGKRNPVIIALLAIVFNSLNAYVNARWISHFGHYSLEWLTDPRFILGVLLFATGYYINRKADRILFALRKPGETGYKMPRGWLYEYVVSPNYLGEILEWIGWAIATWSWAGLSFAVYTFANLAPRARDHRVWYREKFKDFPKKRRALIPFVY